MANHKDTADPKLTRRHVVGAGVVGAAAVALRCSLTRTDKEKSMTAPSKMPVVYLPHGGGPFSYVEMGIPPHEVEALVTYWQQLADLGEQRPRALLIISAHWEAQVPTVMMSPKPPMLYDYGGFPQAAYEIQWPASGDPALGDRVRELLINAGLKTDVDEARGFDHGTFIPLARSFPRADIPCVQLSLQARLDAQEHLAIGRALAPLREEGVLIVGSGMSYHDTRGFMTRETDADAEAFDAWLQDTARSPGGERVRRLAAWEKAPSARRAHPREEHLLPLMVVAGAAVDDDGSVPFSGKVFGKRVSAVQFG